MTTSNIATLPSDAASRGINRREFLHYFLGAGITLLAAESCGLAFWYSLPHPRLGQDIFRIDAASIPEAGTKPEKFREGAFWLRSGVQGLVAISAKCVHDGTYFVWVPDQFRFVCPKCGAKFTVDGAWIDGPAPRDLDRFKIQVYTPSSTRETSNIGDPVNVQDATSIVVDVRQRILKKRTQRCGWVDFEFFQHLYPPCS